MKSAAKEAAVKMLEKLQDIDLSKVSQISVSLMMKPPMHLKKKMMKKMKEHMHDEDGPRKEAEHDSCPKSDADTKLKKSKEVHREEHEQDDERGD